MESSKQEIFIQAYGDYEKSLLRRSFFKVSNKALADDLVQTTFLKTWEYMMKEGKIDSMKAFLFHALNNLIIDEYRKQKPASLDILTEAGFQIAIDDSDRLFNIIDGKTAIILIPLLTEKYRDVVSMRYVDDMTLKEIAEATKQSKSTVAVQIYRGMEKLAILFRLDTTEKTASGA
jgi:RNA polymerase sigma-70 factor (ECF subfamily)